MNPIAEEMLSYLGSSDDPNALAHIGMPRRSGRYPWGSGEDGYQRTRDFIGRIEELKKTGWTETPENIKKEFGLTTTQYRTEKAIAKDQRRMLNVATAKAKLADGKSPTQIGKEMGVNESTVRSWLDAKSEANTNKATKLAEFIKQRVDEKGMIQVGAGTELEVGLATDLNVSKEKLNQALYLLEREGYPVYGGGVPQVTNKGQQTNIKVICPPGTEHKEIYNFDKVHSLTDYVSHDNGETFDRFVFPKSMDKSRLMIRYKDDVGPDGAKGIEKDGIIELRRGVKDLSLGNDHYSQVRILVDGDKYLKGMAVYADDMPKGVDVIFNTNKTPDKGIEGTLKKIKSDPDNPFGSLIKPGGQSYYIDDDGNKQLSLVNKTRGEGDWDEWKDSLPSQFLSKQSLSMAKKQLNLAAADKYNEYDDICSLTNPTIKKHLLSKFADECDSAAVHLQAAALPGQKYHVIIPVNSLKDTEVYAPNYENGTKLALIRYPHGGTFEIPILTVNNKHAAANKLLGKDIVDAVGINSKNAERLSGADFDGDTVMCIPTHDRQGKVKITSTDPLKGLEGFDPKAAYPERPGMKYMKNTGTQMGIVSNLICDMTLKGATPDELARAVRHSMVVIDAEKHKLDYKQSEIDNNIAGLKKKYQSYVDEDGNIHNGGASTLISRAKGETTVLKRQGSPIIDPETGKVSYKTADDLYYPERSYDKKTKMVTMTLTNGKKLTYSMDDKEAVDKYEPVEKINKKTGEVTYESKDGSVKYRVSTRKQKSTRMAETDDAYTLVSDAHTRMEGVYADYANRMKSLANQARKEMMATGKIEVSPTAKEAYADEVASLMSKLNTSLLNAPRERQAHLKANAEVSAKKKAYYDEYGEEMSNKDVQKISQQALTKYRKEVGSVSRRDRSIKITDREWDAIQSGAISENKLKQILNNSDVDELRQRAMPKTTSKLSAAKISTIKAMSASNYTLAEIAKKLGVSTSTVSNYLKGVN